MSTTFTVLPGSLIRLLVTNIKNVFDQLRSSLLNLHQSTSGSSFFFKLMIRDFKSSPESYKVVSSANILQLVFIAYAKSFIAYAMNTIKIRKKRGPRTLPCGTQRIIDIRD